MAEGRIDVYFHGGDEESSAEETGQGLDGINTAPKKNKNDAARSAIASMIISNAKRSMKYGVSIIGDLTGDYQTQRNIESAIEGVGTLVMMSQFPVGTIAGAFSIATSTASQLININKQNRAAALLRERAGNETINNSEVE